MNDFRTILNEKKISVYESIRRSWFLEPKLLGGDDLSCILDLVYFEDGAPQLKDPCLVKVVYKLLELKTRKSYQMKDIYQLITDDQLYSALSYAGVNHAYFICSVYLWVYKTAGFVTPTFDDVIGTWRGELSDDICQSVFNGVSNVLIKKLKLFYD